MTYFFQKSAQFELRSLSNKFHLRFISHFQALTAMDGKEFPCTFCLLFESLLLGSLNFEIFSRAVLPKHSRTAIDFGAVTV